MMIGGRLRALLPDALLLVVDIDEAGDHDYSRLPPTALVRTVSCCFLSLP